MYKLSLALIPVVAALAISTPSDVSANQCSPQEVKKLEMGLKHLEIQASHAKRDPNAKRREAEMHRIDQIDRHMNEALKACKEGRRPQCKAEEVKGLEAEMHHLKEKWHMLMKAPHSAQVERAKKQLDADAHHVTELLHLCKR